MVAVAIKFKVYPLDGPSVWTESDERKRLAEELALLEHRMSYLEKLIGRVVQLLDELKTKAG